MPNICIFAIISAVKRKVTRRSHTKVTYSKYGYMAIVAGVLTERERSDSSEDTRSNHRTHVC